MRLWGFTLAACFCAFLLDNAETSDDGLEDEEANHTVITRTIRSAKKGTRGNLPFKPRKNRSGCGTKDSILNGPSGTISSPNYPSSYPSRSICSWRIVAPVGKRIKLEFQKSFDIERGPNCIFDRMEIRDGPSARAPFILSTCGTSKPATIFSYGNSLHIIFISDESLNRKGFKATYTTETNPNPVVPGSAISVASKCGQPQVKQGRIVGGKIAKMGAWPWQVMITKYGKFECGGVIIDEQWILTAARCVVRSSGSTYPASAFQVIVGNHDRSVKEANEKTYFVSQVKPHQFSKQTPTASFDIALLKVTKSISYNQHVQAVCLPTGNVAAETPCVTTGWGETKGTGNNRYLQQVTVPIIAQSVCRSKTYYGPKVKDDMVCAGLEKGDKDSCEGDTGGPLVCKSTAGDRWHLHGLTSWGEDCGVRKRPGVYTRVRYHREWIKANSGV